MWLLAKAFIGKNWIFIVVGIVIVGLMARVKIISAERDSAIKETELTKKDLAVAVEANVINVTTIEELRKANEAYEKAAASSIEAMGNAVTRLEGISHDINQQTIVIAESRAKILAEPSCEKLANSDIDALCPAYASSLRASANRQRNIFGQSIDANH